MRKEQIVALLFAMMVAASVTTVPATAATYSSTQVSECEDVTYSLVEEGIGVRTLVRKYKSLSSISNKNVTAYLRPTVSINGRALSRKGLVINGAVYIPFRAAATAIGASYSYNSATKTAVMTANGLSMNAGAGCYTVYANDRALFSEHPVVIMNDGIMYIPASVFAKACGMKVSSSSSFVNISGSYKPIAHASKFYREDEVFWLARIIHAESRGEPLLGKIAVGDVVLNRVRSSAYPNTIYGVIFDRKYGVQFSPVLDGSIYNTPDFNSILAAKICLDGYSISDEALFFLEPSHSTSSWIPNNRPYMFTIGKHDFYK